jgi:nicotinate-nucleotide pyrophosphorylase (carboxylating)
MFDLDAEIERNINAAFAEDVGSGDLTAALISEQKSAHGELLSRVRGVLCGVRWFDACFRKLDHGVTISWHVRDGNAIAANQTLCEIAGKARAMLTAERTALNFLQTLSATATATRAYVEAVRGTNALIVDTRKTLPGLRVAQKYAVKAGGGQNHRIGLYDGILLKDNHIAMSRGIAGVFARAQASGAPVQVEVETLSQLEEALGAGAKLVLLDNFNLEDLRAAVGITGRRAQLEASGGITLENVREIAATGVDRISIGSLTKDIKALDLSLRLETDD